MNEEGFRKRIVRFLIDRNGWALPFDISKQMNMKQEWKLYCLMLEEGIIGYENNFVVLTEDHLSETVLRYG